MSGFLVCAECGLIDRHAAHCKKFGIRREIRRCRECNGRIGGEEYPSPICDLCSRLSGDPQVESDALNAAFPKSESEMFDALKDSIDR